jgi:hypothetical protein
MILGMSWPLYAQIDKDLCNEKKPASCLFNESVNDYLKNERYNSDTPSKKEFSIIQLFKSKAFATPQNPDADRKKIREEWKELLGLDVFYPYFKAKEVENYVQQKSAVKLFNLHGKAEFNQESKGLKYIFKKKF